MSDARAESGPGYLEAVSCTDDAADGILSLSLDCFRDVFRFLPLLDKMRFQRTCITVRCAFLALVSAKGEHMHLVDGSLFQLLLQRRRSKFNPAVIYRGLRSSNMRFSSIRLGRGPLARIAQVYSFICICTNTRCAFQFSRDCVRSAYCYMLLESLILYVYCMLLVRADIQSRSVYFTWAPVRSAAESKTLGNAYKYTNMNPSGYTMRGWLSLLYMTFIQP
jgi:hypothetical protein